MELFELTKTLINIPSITGNEASLADFLARHLAEETFQVRSQDIDKGRRNLLAVLGKTPGVILCTHMDTVPDWVEASEDETHIFGRGACDAKGIMAAMIVAASELRDEGLRDIGLLLVVGEETDGIGAQKANRMSPGSKFIVVGEPTGNKLASAHKGFLSLTMAAEGRSAHSSCPEQGESAILKLLDVLTDLRNLDFGRDPVLGSTTLNVGRISGGTAPNIIPGSAEAVLSFRTGISPDRVLTAVRKTAAGRVKISVTAQSRPQVLFTLPGFEQGLMSFGTDIPHLKSFGRPLLLGPGSILDAHTADERIEKKQLAEAVPLYKRLVRELSKE